MSSRYLSVLLLSVTMVLQAAERKPLTPEKRRHRQDKCIAAIEVLGGITKDCFTVDGSSGDFDVLGRFAVFKGYFNSKCQHRLVPLERVVAGDTSSLAFRKALGSMMVLKKKIEGYLANRKTDLKRTKSIVAAITGILNEQLVQAFKREAKVIKLEEDVVCLKKYCP